MATVILDGRSLDPEGVESVALGETVAIADSVRPLLEQGRRIVERHLREGIPVYGLNTGLGARAGQMLAPEALAEFSMRMVRGRAQGLGSPLTAQEVRAVMVTRQLPPLPGAFSNPTLTVHLNFEY